MSFLIPFIPAIASTVFSVLGKHGEGASTDASKQYEAKQLEQRAQQTRASAQRESLEQRRHGRLLNSRLQARAGGGGMDPGIVDLSGDIAAEGEYRALTALYEGEERARGDDAAAGWKRYEGHQARRAGNMGAVTSLFSSFSSGGNLSGLFKKFGGG